MIVLRSSRARQYNPAVIEGPTEPESMSVDDISQLLRAWNDGDQLALDELTPIVYADHCLLYPSLRFAAPSGHSRDWSTERGCRSCRLPRGRAARMARSDACAGRQPPFVDAGQRIETVSTRVDRLGRICDSAHARDDRS